MKTWPPDKPKGAIVILTQISRLHQLKELLGALDTYFLNKFPYPIVLYHEENYRPLIPQAKTFTKAELFFQEIQFKMPEFINMSAVPEMACLKGIGKFGKMYQCIVFFQNVTWLLYGASNFGLQQK